ncbi:MAG: hypothetical protein R3F41_05250 [Gammaproteobacteria bacterium]|nr:hypothetical protein [Pseudomonadales bacterium]MCP5345290.1 hypothetical protein [Pseudomonadales bacterium]
MIRIYYRSVLTGIFLITLARTISAQPGPGPGYGCPSCGVEYADTQVMIEILSDLLDVSPGMVNVVQGQEPGVYTVTLPDGTTLSLSPVGPTFRYQNAVQRRLEHTEEGGLRLRSQSRAELQIRSAIHRQAELIGELLRLGWTNFYWFQQGLEMESPAGERYCFGPDLVLASVNAPGVINVEIDAEGNLWVTHPDGIRQRLHACAHDFFQLRDQVRTAVQQQLMLNADGTFQLMFGEQTLRFRLNAELAWTDELDHPGFYTEGDRILLRYRDGWAQEVVLLDQ